MTKQTNMNGVEMQDLDGNVVQVAASDFEVGEDGSMFARGTTDGKVPMHACV